MRIFNYRLATILLSSLLLALAVSVFFPGCDDTVLYGNPRLIFAPSEIGGEALLAVESVGYAEEAQSFSVISAAAPAYDKWEISGPFGDRLVAVTADSDGKEVLLVFADGSVYRWAGKGKNLEEVSRGSSDRSFLAARTISGSLYAVELLESGNLQMYRKTGKDWSSEGESVAMVGSPKMVSLSEYRGQALIMWRSKIGNSVEPGLRAATLNDSGTWDAFETGPAASGKGYYAALSLGGSLLLVSEPDTGVVMPHERLETWLFDKGAWFEITGGIELPAEIQFQQPLGLAVASDGDRVMVVRADSSGIHPFLGKSSSGPWERGESSFSRGDSSPWTMSLLFLGLTAMFFVLTMWRFSKIRLGKPGYGLRVRPVGSLAGLTDRGMAMIIDSLLVLPLPFMFFLSGSDFDLNMIPASEAALFYWLWLGGLSFYLAISEAVWGASVGKKLFGIRVRSATGGPVTPGQAIIRNAARFIDFFPVSLGGLAMPYLVALVSFTLSRARQRLGDRFARTVVFTRTPLEKRSFVLASSSPRRRELFAALEYDFSVANPEIDETPAAHLTPEQDTVRLAQRKAEEVARRLKGDEVVIAADTIVEFEGKVIGKPVDEEDAVRILKLLSGKRHTIITAVTVVDRATGQSFAAADHTDVVMAELSDEDIRAYVASGEAMGKAGAYAIQETGDAFIKEVNGSLSNVIGLPMEMLTDMLKAIDA